MKKKTPVRKRVGNPILTEDEQTMVDAGCRLLPHRMVELRVAWKADFRDVVFALGKDVANHTITSWLDGYIHLPDIQSRLATSLEYIIADSEESAELGGELRSYESGLELILKLAQIGLSESIESVLKKPESREEIRILIHKIQSCMIALIAQGDIRHATYLGRFAGACSWMSLHENGENQEMLRAGARKAHGKSIDRLKMLLQLKEILEDGEIPTKKALRIHTFEHKEQSEFTDLLRGMKIHKLLPDESRGRKSSESSRGTFHRGCYLQTHNSEDESLESARFTESSKQMLEINEKIRCLETREQRSLKPSGDPKMVDVETRRIKEALGPVYHLLLIQFGMGEIQTAADLEGFEQKLVDLGLKLL